jgi:hypothetical protein
MHTNAIVADGARWALIAVMVLAGAEKFTSLRRRAAAWHPVMLVSLRRRHWAQLLMSTALLLDICAALFLVVTPQLGAALASAAILTYTWASLPMHHADKPADCRCFIGVLNTRTRVGFLARNSLLFLFTLAILVRRPEASWAGVMLGGVLLAVVLLIAAGADRLNRLDPSLGKGATDSEDDALVSRAFDVLDHREGS